MDILAGVLIVVFVVGILAFAIWVNVRILHKAGYSGWWAITIFIPFVNLIMIWVFAFADWPALREPHTGIAPPPRNERI